MSRTLCNEIGSFLYVPIKRGEFAILRILLFFISGSVFSYRPSAFFLSMARSAASTMPWGEMPK